MCDVSFFCKCILIEPNQVFLFTIYKHNVYNFWLGILCVGYNICELLENIRWIKLWTEQPVDFFIIILFYFYFFCLTVRSGMKGMLNRQVFLFPIFVKS